ncbi:chromodomain-helicase-DNA-binding protein 7 isoform X2 [Oncorhynchus mykiss]|uniref:chromodomain-helicase-DNA-binding protein 7 isoform X2 n=1 Tax=Oncorhynchus mykiss TaxID=8022 RepID=UPI0018776CEC|nr:chromodomain-helicase-DNA-binding protein 7 isoform X2 [Oncorhynchus mykiss]
MADPGMLSLFGDDANLFSDELEGLGDCGFPQGQPNPIGQQEHQGYRSLSSNSLHHPSQAGPGQPKMGHPYDPFAGYEQQQGNGPAVNGMVTPHSRYHNSPQQPGGGHHVYPRAQGDGHGQSFPDGGAVWGPQTGPGQGRPPFQQQQASPQGPSHQQHGPSVPQAPSHQQHGPSGPQAPSHQQHGPSGPQAASHQQHDPSGPQDHGHRMGPYMGRSDYATMQGHPGQTQTPPRINHFPPGMGQEPNHYMGHVGLQQNSSMTAHPAQQQQPPQQFLHRPGQGPVHTQDHMASHTSHQQHQGLAGRPHQNMGFNMHGQAASPDAVTSSGPYPPYPQYGNLNQGLAGSAGMSPRMSLSSTSNNNSSACGPMGPDQVQCYPNAGGAPQCYPDPQVHRQPVHPNQITGQPMHPSQAQATPHKQPHLPTPPHGSYGSPTSMSPMKGMGTTAVTPLPQQVRPPSAGLAPEVGAYPGVPLQAPNPMAPPQRNTTPLGVQQPQHHPQHLSHPQQHPHMPPSQQLYQGMSPNQRGPLDQVRPPGPMAHGEHPGPQDQQLLTPQQQAPKSGLQPPPMAFQQQVHPAQTALPPSQAQTHLAGPHHQSSPPNQPPWAPAGHQSPTTPQKVPHIQYSTSSEMTASDRTPASGANLQPANRDKKPTEQKPKKKKAKVMVEGEKKPKKKKGGCIEECGEEGKRKVGDGPWAEVNCLTGALEESLVVKTKKKPKEPKEPKTPKTPKTPKEPKEKAKSTTPKVKMPKKPSTKKVESAEGSGSSVKEIKRTREPSVSSDVEKSPPGPSDEDDDDDGVQKRRSSRQVKRKRYTEELEFRISDDDGDVSPTPKSPFNTSEQQEVETEGPVVEKILSIRMGKKEMESGEKMEVEEFYVKFKSFSYLHCRWADLEELEKDKRIHQKVKRFRAKQALPTFVTEMDDEPFNPDYVEVDRVLDVSESTDENGEPVKLYLVKWCSLPYEDITWELKADIDQAKIDEYEAVAARQPETKRVERPPTENWQKSESSRDYKNDNALRDYQLEGVNWLLFNWYNTRNCILADEMGLGKTIQSITFLYEIYLKGIHGPFLVIAPLSTIPNWEREFRTWTELNVIVYHGSQASRKTIQAYEMNYRDVQGRVIKGAYKFHAVITTFEMILTDCPELRSVSWRCVVIDEAHRLKNRNCKLLEGLKMMDMEHKVLLTGTPLQNTVEELFSLLNFLEPERFPSENTFMQEFGDLKTEEQVQKLQAILKPMMLRRLKEDVEKNLAPKEETIIEVELTNIQKKYYRAILEKNFSFLSKGGPGGGGGAWGGGGAQVPNLLNTMMELRKCCNHPYLINGAEEKILDDFRENHHAEMPQFHLQAMIQAAGKLVLIDKLLPKLKAGGHRVLVFSQMVRCLDILEDYLIQKRYPYERIDGRVRGNLRQAAIDRFSRPDSDRFVFLLCTRAGGLGINLTAADTCIIFDSDWNPQNDLQAQARCHRIGQSKAVKIYRLITRNSYEREMFDKASLKLGLDKAVLQSMSGRENAANGVPQLSKKEVEDLLRKGAYGALMDEEDEGSKFCEEDIDQILLRRTQTITIESEGKGSTFAKASFVAAGNRTDISLEDPDFWQKWAKKAELDMEAINGRNTLVIDTPRVRKQTRHYSSMKEDELAEFSELESDGENEKPLTKLRRPQDRAHGYPRSECFRVEKNLLVYGWGRWGDILSRGRFKRPLQEQDVETICRALLAYCLLHYRGDENIKRFIWDLITPSEDGQSRTLTNHSGLSTPVPRGRKGKKGKPAPPAPPQLPRAEWLASCNPDLLLQEDSYKRHLKHHCNKVLLRVRMLYYLRQEVIGDHADRILEGTDSSEMDIWIPQPFHAEVPADWWDSEADKSLLIGVFKHGYEKYNSMRADPALCFLERVGMPDAKAIAAEQRGADMMADGPEGEDEDPEYKPLRMTFKDEMEDFANSPLDDKDETVDIESGESKPGENIAGSRGAGRLYWPAASALTARLRRLITAYQRTHKREQLRQEAMARPDGRRRRRPREHLFSMVTDGGGAYVQEDGAFMAEGSPYMAKGGAFIPEATVLPAEGGAAFKERRQRWTRREESDFYRVVSTFGVIYDTDRQLFDWTQFRAFARLDKKSDESLEKYYFSFVAMCKRVCRMQVKANTELPDPTLIIDPITEERASRTLYRIELLRRIREQVLPNPLLGERLRLCQPSSDLPEWWACRRHDHDLLLGASKHGVSRTDYHILNDPALGFLEAHRKFTKGTSAGVPQPPRDGALSTASSSSTEQATATAGAEKSLPVQEEEEGKEMKEEGDDIPCTKPEKPDEGKEEEMEAKKEEKAGSPKKVKDEKGEEEDREEKVEVTGDADGETSKEAKPEKEYKAPTEETKDQDKKLDFLEKPESPKASEEQGTKKEERDEKEGSLAKSPKPVAEKGPDEEKMEEDDKSEKSSQAEAGATSEQKNFDEESNASLSTTARDETRDGFCPEEEPSAIPALQERTTSSFWPKDRVMINRMDNICDAVIKGKWPANRRQFFDFPGLLPGYPGPMTSESPMPRRSLAELSMTAQTNFSGSEDLTLSPQVNEDALSISLPKQRRRRRRKVEIEAERAAKRRNLMDMVAQLRESHAAESQSQAMDLTKGILHQHHKSSAPSPVSFSSSMVSPAALKAQMELLQAATPSRHRANCSLAEADLPTRRRRGRRKNVEGLELLFMRGATEDSERTKASVEGLQMPPRSHHHNIPSTSARVPSVSAMEDREAGTPSNKDLSDWLRQHPTYTMDMPTAYTPKSEETLLSSQFPKPKQKRHRCRNPNKIDINTLTGEERVPVVNRRNGRKMGGAMAPPMKDLPRWLLENSDFAVAPDWTDIVKQSGFLPEAMFDRLLTGPLVREEGVRRRGRRPKSEIAKATAAASSGGLNPLLINSLFGGMDLTSLQGLQSLQSLQLQLMGFPGMGGADAKHASAMLPLMLPGMAGMGVLPNMFGLGGLFASNLAAASPAAASNGTNNEDDSDETSKRDAREGGEEQDEEKDDTGEEEESSKAIGEAAALNVAAAATASSGMSANSMAFNPFLLSTMAPGLFSPYMFLPPGLGGLTLPGFPPTALTDLQSAMAGAMGVASGAQGQEKEPNQVALDCPAAAIADPETADDSDSAESLEKTAESSALEDETSALAGEADSPEDLEEGEDALEEEEK